MKGMQRISRGKGFRGALDYAFYDKENPGPADKRRGYDGELIGGNMSGTSPRELAAEFKIAQQIRPDIEKKVWHQSLRLPEGEKLSKDGWVKFADDYMQRMGFNENHQRAYVLHDDAKGQHVHIIASRVDLEGSVNVGRHESMKSTAHLQQMEKEYGLTITKGPTYTPDGKLEMPDVRGPKKNEIEMGVRKSELPPRMHLQGEISKALKEGPTMRQFVERLEAADIKAVPHVTESGRMNGFAFEFDDVRFKGSDLGKKYTWNGLQKEGLDYDKTRDTAFLQELRAQQGLELSRDAAANAEFAKPVQPDTRADAGPAAATHAVAVDAEPERERDADAARADRAVTVETRQEPESVIDRAPAPAKSDEPARGLDAADHRSSDQRLDSRPSLNATEVARAIEQLPAAERKPIVDRIIERMQELRAQPAVPVAQASLLDRLINKVREFFGLKHPKAKEKDLGRDGNRPDGSRERDREPTLAATGGGSGAKPAFGPRPGSSPASRSAHAEPRHRASPAEDRLPSGQVALLRDRMQRLSHGDVGASWGHAQSALFKDVSRDLDKRRADEPDRLLSTRGSTPADRVTPAAPAPIAAPYPIVTQAKAIEPTKPVEKPNPVLDDAERTRRAEEQRQAEDRRREDIRAEHRKHDDIRRIADKAIGSGNAKEQSSALLRAVESGDRTSIDRLVDAGAPVNNKTLEKAAANNESIFKQLVSARVGGNLHDANAIRGFAGEVGPLARQKLETYVQKAEDQGHTTGLGITGSTSFKTSSDFKSSDPDFGRGGWSRFSAPGW